MLWILDETPHHIVIKCNRRLFKQKYIDLKIYATQAINQLKLLILRQKLKSFQANSIQLKPKGKHKHTT